jgi:hypothetical protein
MPPPGGPYDGCTMFGAEFKGCALGVAGNVLGTARTGGTAMVAGGGATADVCDIVETFGVNDDDNPLLGGMALAPFIGA